MTLPHDAPTAVELLTAVREWMERDLFPIIDGRLQFHTRVAMNILDLVGREIALGPEQEKEHRATLDELGMNSDSELAAAIRGGSFDSELGRLLEVLRPSIENKLKVSNPRYLRD